MLGVTAEQFPRRRAAHLVDGRHGMLSVAVALPIMGAEIDVRSGAALQIFAIPTAILFVIFGGLLFYFKARGGYRAVQLRAGRWRASRMSLAHLTLPTRDVDRTARSSRRRWATRGVRCRELTGRRGVARYRRRPADARVLRQGFEVSPFEREFGRHVAVSTRWSSLRRSKRGCRTGSGPRRAAQGDAVRALLLFARPVNGYVCRGGPLGRAWAIHLDQ